MPLSWEQLEQIRDEQLADDVPVEPHMLEWSERVATQYFESGGSPLLDPTAQPNLLHGHALQLQQDKAVHAWSALVPAKWLDYNGHMTDAVYGLAFAAASDASLTQLRLHGRRHFLATQAMTRHLKEVRAGDVLLAATRVLGVGRDSIQLRHELTATRSEGSAVVTIQETDLLHVSRGSLDGGGRLLERSALPREGARLARAIGLEQDTLPPPKHTGQGVRRPTAAAAASLYVMKAMAAAAPPLPPLKFTVCAAWTDPAGVILEEWYTYMCCCQEHFVTRAIGFDEARVHETGTFFAAESCVWHEPFVTKADDVLRVEAHVLNVDELRVHAMYEVWIDSSAEGVPDTPVATLEHILLHMAVAQGQSAHLDGSTRALTPMPEHWLRNAQRLCALTTFSPPTERSGKLLGTGVRSCGFETQFEDQ
ncbi:hypothetical protein AB1Y20_018723 [Prymnesium parvum]|uniref:Thioesterase domain-containing protein n=1 Tax=Prymnesium parvum TaxID=97485 RepID=A0AB34JPI3_PRYPA